MINKDHGKSIRSLARVLNVDEKTIRNCVHEEIRCNSYALKKLQLIKESKWIVGRIMQRDCSAS